MTKTQTAPAAQTATCRRCKATLRSAKSVTNGIGPTCSRKERAEAAVSGFKPALVAKAMELIADKGIKAIRARRVFEVVSTNGSAKYKTAPQACNCAAGLKAKHTCYHRIAATYLAA